jgi:hypothetical protein
MFNRAISGTRHPINKLLMLIYRKKYAKNFKQAYVLAEKNGSVITEGTSLEVLFELLRARELMTPLERVQVNLLIYEAFGFYPDTIEQPNRRTEKPTHSQEKMAIPAA